MKKIFVKTHNYSQFEEIAAELLSPDSEIGPSLAMGSGRAGRGKTEVAKYYAVNSDSIYIRSLPVMSPSMALREICFELRELRPHTSQACLNLIEEEMRRRKRLIIFDEADLVPIQVLETLRGLNERAGCPIFLIGEEELRRKVESRTRITSRIRRKMEFAPITQGDVALFYKQSVDMELTPEVLRELFKRSKGDWRPMVKEAADIERAVKATGMDNIDLKGLREILK